MSRLSLRLSLLLLCLAALAGAAYLLWSSNRTSKLDLAAMRQFETHARAATAGIADLRAAQQSYVAVGQGEDFWFARVDAIRKDVEARIAAMRLGSTASGAATDLDAAAAALQDFAQMDGRARDSARGRQLTLASDMVFGDGFDLTKKAGDAVERAVMAEQTERDAAAASVRRQQVLALAGAAAIVFLTLVLLVPVRRSRDASAVPVESQAVGTASDQRVMDLDDFRVVAPPAPVARPQVDLERIAALCGDLARVPDTQALPALLERAAGILDASGIVLWIADPDGRELSPILVHGYSPQLALRLGTIARDAANVTAAAYRTGLLQTVKGDAISSGAIAVPLVAAGGCVGVMAAEVKDGGEQQDALLAAARIIASQLATLVGPPAARAKTEAAG